MMLDTELEGLADFGAAGPHVTWIEDGQFAAVRMPIPLRTLPVNCYVLSGVDGWTVIDAGIGLGATTLWAAAMSALNIEPRTVTEIVITHFHPDHIGGLAALTAMAAPNVRLLASPLTVDQTPDMWGEHMERTFEHLTAHLVRHGLPDRRVAELENEPALARIAVDIPPAMQPALTDGTVLSLAGAQWTVVHTPGHADGHICLYDQAGRRLISADHLLERISPAIGLWPDHSQNPLADYLGALDRIAALDVDTVYPGHGAPFSGHSARVQALHNHHDERLQACVDALDIPRTAHDVALMVFGTELDAANERYATTEAIAHLAYAEIVRNEVGSEERDGVVLFTRVAKSSSNG